MVGVTAALVGGGLALGGAVLSSKSANKNSKRAAQTSQDNTAANNALAREIYGNNQQVLNPWMQRGNAAGGAINDLLGLGGGTQPMQQQQVQPNALSQFQGGQPAGYGYGLGDGYLGAGSYINTPGMSQAGMNDLSPQVGSSFNFSGNGLTGANSFMSGLSPYQTQQPAAQTGAVQMGPAQTATGAQNSAFDNFRNSTGYQFRLGEGMDAFNSGWAGAGTLQSGAAARGAMEYGQNFASNEFGNYLGALQSQQAVGAGAASSLAGVGQNYAGTVINSNNQNAANQMNAQLGRQNGFANALGSIGGSVLGYGLGQ